MTLKDDLLRKGYLPENTPPSFRTSPIADYMLQHPITGYYTRRHTITRPARYNASKRGITRRVFSFVHPTTAHDLAHFLDTRWNELQSFFLRTGNSLSRPSHNPDASRALQITPHHQLERERIDRLAGYRFIACTDIARFYHSIYTHSVPWAVHGRTAAKADRNPQSSQIFCNRLDYILRGGQDGQTVGIPVGPDASRAIAELIGTAIDIAFEQRAEDIECAVLRHVDDIWIGAHTHAEAERALSRYREAIREFELDINETKTRIWSEQYRFFDDWPTDVATRIDFAVHSREHYIEERLRAALEHVFGLAVEENDEGILRYAMRYLDQNGIVRQHWTAVEPFLKRSAVHYGHSIDFVSRIIVWRHVVEGDFDSEAWRDIFLQILDRHGRLGNDSEVAWSLYTCLRLRIVVPNQTATQILANCGALSIVALLNLSENGLVDGDVFSDAFARFEGETAAGPSWPILLEWVSREWTRYREITLNQDLVESMADDSVRLFDASRLPAVFTDVDDEDVASIEFAIEDFTGTYDEDAVEEASIDDADDDEPF